MAINDEIKDKRKSLGLTQKDFADALGMGKNGERTLRRWENGESTPSTLEYNTIISFAETIPFKNEKDDSGFQFIDLFP